MKYDFHFNQFIETETLPGKIAIAGSDADIDWETLKNYTLNLSAQFKKLDIPQGHPVIIYGHKEFFFPVAVLACFHSGIPYIPIDKIYPLARIKKIRGIAGARVLINCSSDIIDIPFAITIHQDLETKINFTPLYENRMYGSTDAPLQYIMFTSGSTGEPKGVQV